MNNHRIAIVVAALAMLSLDSLAQDPSARVVIPPWIDPSELPRFDAEPFLSEKSPRPKPGDWTAAPRVRLSRVSSRITGCEAKRLREWIRIHCERRTAGARLLAGSTEGIEIWVAEALPDPVNAGVLRSDTEGRFGAIVFPVRKGDRRVFEIFDLDYAYDGNVPRSSILAEEHWLDAANSPEIALLVP